MASRVEIRKNTRRVEILNGCGLLDVEIAEILNVARSTVRRMREGSGMVSNYPLRKMGMLERGGRVMSAEEILENGLAALAKAEDWINEPAEEEEDA